MGGEEDRNTAGEDGIEGGPPGEGVAGGLQAELRPSHDVQHLSRFVALTRSAAAFQEAAPG